MTIVLNPAQIAFEMTVVNQIEAQQGGKGTPVRLGDSFAGKITSLAYSLVQGIESVKYFSRRFFVGLLASGEAGAINAIVQVFVNKIVDRIDFVTQSFGIKVVLHVGPHGEGGI